MKNILITIPTKLEAEHILQHIDPTKINNYKFKFKNKIILFTGAGTPSTILTLTEELVKNNYKLIISLGIAGTYTKKLNPGTITLVKKDIFADIGTHNQHIIDMELPFSYINKINKKFLIPNIPEKLNIFTNVLGATYNSVSETIPQANKRKNLYNSDIETMENAASILIANYFNLPIIPIRTISNTAGDRNKQNWKIKLATKNLFLALNKILKLCE